jgi:glycosyltransferase involved in cell wall biosynthesis
MNKKILFLADANSPHTIRWAKAIMNSGYRIGIFCFFKIDSSFYSDFKEIKLYSLNISRNLQSTSEDNFSKLIYLKAVREVKRILKDFKPDIVHAHYASSYGLIGAMSGFHPYIISMWGSDVFGFPNHSFLHKRILMFNLSKADKLLSTSIKMKTEAEKYTKKEILVTPFGIDVNKFKAKVVNTIFEKDDIVIGTIKTLEKIYGIEYLIKAFKIVKTKSPESKIKLLLVGEGTQRKNLEDLATELNLYSDIVFIGYVNSDEVENYHNMLDIYVAVSLQESFGVAVLEASACGNPVIVSNVGGLPEVVDDGKTGIIVEKENPYQLANAIIELITNPNLRIEMGINGRKKVLNEYNWINSVKLMLLIYNQLLDGYIKN